MGALSIGEILARTGPASRAFQPVRRNSYYATDRRSTALWRPIAANNREAGKIVSARMKAAELYDRAHKQPGQRNGPLGHVGLEVLRELYRLVDFRTGRLDPAITTICDRTKRSKQAVVDALKRLKEHGFLDWVRRSEPVEDAQGAGPRIRQISNAYGLKLPEVAAEWVARKLSNGPTPDDAAQLEETREVELQTMLATLTRFEFVNATVGIPELAAALASWAASAGEKERESTEHEETNPSIIYRTKHHEALVSKSRTG